MMRNEVIFYLNGELHQVSGAHVGWMMADYLRYHRGLTGTKIVCAEGDCGACTVLKITEEEVLPVNACILTVLQMDAAAWVTVDALARPATPTDPKKLTPVQSAMVSCHGSQCGFCTPGFVMALTGLVERKCSLKKEQRRENTKRAPAITALEAKNALTGNLCRCTGYQPIIDAAQAIDLSQCEPIADRFFTPTQRRELRKLTAKGLEIKSTEFAAFAPTRLTEVSRYLIQHKEAHVVGATTDLGVLHNKRKLRLDRVVSLHLVADAKNSYAPLRSIRVLKKTKNSIHLSIGASVSLTHLRRFMQPISPEFARFLDLFASPQIKNVATLAGNVGNASPIADTPPFLLVHDTEVILQGPRTRRSVPIDRFYKGYRQTAIRRGEVIAAIELELPLGQALRGEVLSLKKVSQRKDLDISAVNAAFRLGWEPAPSSTVANLRVALGGVAATPIRLHKTEALFRKAKFDPELIERAITTLQAEITPIADLRGSVAYRRIVVENLFREFLESVKPK